MLEPQIIDIQSFKDDRGYLSVIEALNHIPFEVDNSYWVYNLSKNDSHKKAEYIDNLKLIVALSGEFDVIVDNGIILKEFNLNKAFHGLLIPRGFDYNVKNCNSNALIFVMISK